MFIYDDDKIFVIDLQSKNLLGRRNDDKIFCETWSIISDLQTKNLLSRRNDDTIFCEIWSITS